MCVGLMKVWVFSEAGIEKNGAKTFTRRQKMNKRGGA